jgi:hypothetical protein
MMMNGIVGRWGESGARGVRGGQRGTAVGDIIPIGRTIPTTTDGICYP